MLIRGRINGLDRPVSVVLLRWPLSGVGLESEVSPAVQGVYGTLLTEVSASLTLIGRTVFVYVENT